MECQKVKIYVSSIDIVYLCLFDLPVTISSLIRIRSLHLLPIFLSATTKQLIENMEQMWRSSFNQIGIS